MTDYNRRKGLSAAVHRFRDQVAVHVGTGETVYLTQRQARTLARELYRTARDIDNRAFAESDAVPVEIKIN